MIRKYRWNNRNKCVCLFLTLMLLVAGVMNVTLIVVGADQIETEFSGNSNVSANSTTIAPSAVGAGKTYVGMLNITFNNTGGIYDALEWINVTVLNYTDVETVTIWNETDDDGQFSSSGDTLMGSADVKLLLGELGFANITGLKLGILNGTNMSIYVVFNISASAIHGHYINASILPFNMSMTNADSGGLIALYPAYNTIIDTKAPIILSITTTDPDRDGNVENATIVFSEAINDSSVDVSRFSIGGVVCNSFSTLTTPNDNIIEISIATDILGTDAKDVTYSYLVDTCTDLVGNELLTVTTNDVFEHDNASPVLLSAVTDDHNKNGLIDRYYLTFSENITVYQGFYSEIQVSGYMVDTDNSHQSAPNEVTLVLFEGLDFDTGMSPEITYPAGLGSLVDLAAPIPIDIASGDLNNDTYPDIAILNARSESITVFLNNGLGQFTTRCDYPSGITRGNITVGDVNNDGLNDVVATNYYAGEVLVFIQNTITNNLNAYMNYLSGNGTLGVAIGDVNDDERNDVVVANFDDDEIAVFLQNSTGGLAVPTKYSSGNGPTDVIIAEIAKAEDYGYVLYDVVVTNYLDDTITPYRQTTGGVLTILAALTTPDGPTGIATGDLNGDGGIDVAITNRNDNSISIFQQYMSSWSNTYLSSSYRYDYYVDLAPVDISIIDANNDGSNDIVTSNPGNNSIAFMLQYGSGNFYLGWNKTLGNTPYGLTADDFDLDGRFDVATTQPYGNHLTILLQEPGELVYEQRQDIYLGSSSRSYNPRAVDIGDINNDGYDDIVIADYNVVRISVLYGTPGGGYRDKVEYSTYNSGWWYPYDVKIGDINNDGRNDVVVILNNADRLAVFYQSISGILDDPIYLTTGSSPRRLAIGDVNHDGLNDVVVTNYYSYTISVYIQNSGTGQLNPKQDYPTGLYYPQGVAIGEVSGDNRNDVVVTHDYSSQYYHMVRFKQKSDGTLAAAEQFQWENSQSRYFYDVEIGDMNGDGRNDIISATRNSNQIGVWYQNVAKTFGLATRYSMDYSNIYDLELADIDQNGKDDIVAISQNSYYVMLLGQTTTGLSDWGSYAVGPNPYGVAVGDVNSDNRIDIVTANYNDNSITILTQNPITGAYNLAKFTSTHDYPYHMAKGDVNNDGIIDIAVVNEGSTYYLSIFLGMSNGLFKPRIDYYLQYYPYCVAIGDVNNDGRNDVVVGDDYYSILVFRQKSDGTLDSNYQRYSCGSYPYDIAIGDLNNDGRNDVAVSTYSYMYYYRQTTTGTLGSYSVYYLAGNDLFAVAIGDLNNDSRNDVAFCDRDNYYIKYLLQTDSGFSSYYTLTPGSSPRDIEIADLNNDGLDDIVNTNYYSNTISVFTQISNGGFEVASNYATNSYPWGLDVADFNADGLLDVITADYSSSTISIFTQNDEGFMNIKESYGVYDNPYYVKACDFNNDGVFEIVTMHPNDDYLYVIYPEKNIGTDSNSMNYDLGSNSLHQVLSGDVLELDGADPVFAQAITGDLTGGNSSAYNRIMVRCSEDLNDTTIAVSDFSVSGGITVTTANEISPGNILLSTSTLNSYDTPTVSLVGSIMDANGLTVPLGSRKALDGLRPRAVSAVTMDIDLNGQLDEYIITFDEDIFGTSNGTGFSVVGYTIDNQTSLQSASNKLILGLVEKTGSDTGLTPNINYMPGNIKDSAGNYLADVTAMTESDGAPPATAEFYINQIYESHPNLYAPDNSTLYYNNTPSGLIALFTLRLEAEDNGRLDYASGEDAFGNISVQDDTENTGGTTWEYELTYEINQGETKNGGITVWVYDLDYNNASDYISVVLDTTPPETMMSTPLGVNYVAKFTPITLTGMDQAGIYETKYQVDSDPWQTYMGPFKLNGYSFGQHTLSFYSVDNVGNSETIHVQPVYIAQDWTDGGSTSGSFSNIVILGCNITISGTMVLENVTILINNTNYNNQWINVTSTGKLVIRNSTILSVDPLYGSKVLIHGELNMYQTHMQDLWTDTPNTLGGIYINSSTVTIEKSSISNAAGAAITIADADPIINDTVITNSILGIKVLAGAPTITNNDISDVYQGMWIANNTATITIQQNSIAAATVGIWCQDLFKVKSDVRITQNTFNDISYRAVHVENAFISNSALMIDNNTIENVGGGIYIKNSYNSTVYIKDNIVKNLTGYNTGIGSTNTQNIYILRNDFTNTLGDVIRVAKNSDNAVVSQNTVNGGSGVQFTHNVISVQTSQGNIYINNNDIINVRNIDGIGTWQNENGTTIQINSNTLADNTYGGIWCEEFADLVYIKNNTIESNSYGIWVMHTERDSNDKIDIKNNIIKNCTKYLGWSAGISVDQINNLNIENNYIYNTEDVGIEIYDEVWGELIIEDNIMEENGAEGLYLWDSDVDISKSIRNNTFLKNDGGVYAFYIDFNPGTLNIYDKTTFVDNYPYFDGYSSELIIHPGANWSFASTTLDWFSDITVLRGGSFYAYDTIISGPAYYNFNVYGNLYLASCTVEYARELYIEDPENVYLIGTIIQYCNSNGIHLKNANITLQNIRFTDNYGTGLFVEGSKPIVRRCLFDSNDYQGIYGVDFKGTITECEFYYNGEDGIWLKNSQGIISKNIFYYNYANNINLIYSSTTIDQNAIWYAYNYGINLDHSNAHILNNIDSNRLISNYGWGTRNCGIFDCRADNIYVYYSNPYIENNTIENSMKNGISLLYSGGHIEYNEIAWNDGSGIGKFNEKNPNIHDNYLHDNGDSPPNRAPSATGGTILPQYPIYTSTLRITPVGWYDPDGDPPGFLYQWQKKISNVWTNIAGATGSTLVGGIFGGDEIRCKLTPWDGKTTGPKVNSSTVIINNSAPSITGASISPSPAYDNSALTAVPNGFSDPDQDTNQVYYYQWYNQSGLLSGATSATLPPSKFKANDTIYCKVTPSDGQDNGTTVKSVSVLIIHYVDPGQTVADYDGDGVPDAQDAFPYDPKEWRDTDLDNIGDNSDPDIDGDGKNNTIDAFDYDKYEWKDSDNDGVGDNTDQDDDNDGYLDSHDAFPFNPLEWRDTDSDNIGDNSDDDIDGDGKNNTIDAFDYDRYEWKDSDNDGVGDNTDQDDDDDGYYDSLDAFPLNPNEYLDTDKDKIGDNADTDDDGDGYLDDWEAFLGTDNKSSLSKPLDTDKDGKPDGDKTNSKTWMDSDDDDDGFNDTDELANNTDPKDPESYPGMPNRPPTITKVSLSPTPAYDNSILTAVPEGFSDPDGDTTQVYYYRWYVNNVLVTNVSTSYITPTNFATNDTVYCIVTPSDGEDNGTALKSNIVLIIHYVQSGDKPKDYDGDGVIDSQDAFPYDKNEWRDTDFDGIGDNSDPDIDGDGKNNTVDAFDFDKYEWKDSDNDGIGDNTDQDDDNDGYYDVNDDFPLDPAEHLDNDKDGTGDIADTDDDNDGYLDTWETFLGTDSKSHSSQPLDTDSDGIPNGDSTNSQGWMDTDDDADGHSDSAEKTAGTDPLDPNSYPGAPNRAPSISKVTISPSPAYDNAVLTAIPEGFSDPDGITTQIYYYQWYVNGLKLSGQTLSYLTPTNFKANDTVFCMITPSDGMNNGTAVKSNIILVIHYTEPGQEPKDYDGDGVPDQQDAFPYDFNEWRDTDGDGIGDNSDPDIDGDGYNNNVEIAAGSNPNNDNSIPGDIDGDSILDINDNDIDGDNVTNGKDDFPYDKTETKDSDDDGIGDNSDQDDDNDGILDSQDEFPFNPNEWKDTDGDGIGDNSDPDIDGDGVNNDDDDFPDDRTESKDTDGDGIGDNNDRDIDGDGVTNEGDDFPNDKNEWRDTDDDGLGDNTDLDIDGDGIDNENDTFPFDKSNWEDTDGDKIGDNNDPDDDNDGKPDLQDEFPKDPDEWKDSDGDGQGDNSDNDRDGDSVDNSNDLFPDDNSEWLDHDGDGLGDNKDPDDDNDGYYDSIDRFPFDNTQWRDTDDDGLGDNLEGNDPDPDIDGDGVLNTNDKFPNDKDEWEDTDNDGIGNNKDPDDDNDGYIDIKDDYPLDPDRFEKPEETTTGEKAKDEGGIDFNLIALIMVMILVLIFLGFMYFKLNQQLGKEETEKKTTKPDRGIGKRTFEDRDLITKVRDTEKTRKQPSVSKVMPSEQLKRKMPKSRSGDDLEKPDNSTRPPRKNNKKNRQKIKGDE